MARSNVTMKTFLSVAIFIGLLLGCQKQQSEDDRKAEIEREVQQRLAAEHQATEKQQLDQREADLKEREQTLTDQERASERSQTRPAATAARRESSVGAPPSGGGGYAMFYARLEPYGEWFETDNYGYVWRPREVERSRNWHPYTNGHWAYTDAGWTWVSEEPFGWATYHYGRWTRLRDVGWVWVPGNEWAPAWVSWRKSDNYVGWAPLPPEARFERRSGIRNWADNYYDIGPDQYCFVSTREFGQQRVETAVVPSERNVTIVNETTNVTNITYNNTTIVNQGPSYDELRSRSQQPIERLRLQREANVNFETGNPRSVVKGEVLEIPAPVIGPAEPNERPRSASRVTAAVDLGWAAIADHEAANRVRAKMRSEATPPPDAPPKTFTKPAETTAVSTPVTATTPAAVDTRPENAAAVTSSPTVSANPTVAPTSTPVGRRSVPSRFTGSSTIAPSLTPQGNTGARVGQTALPSVAPTVTPTERALSPTANPSTEQSPTPTASPTLPPRHTPPANLQSPQTPPKEMNLHPQPLEHGRGNRPAPPESPTPTPFSSPQTSASASPLDKREMLRQLQEQKKQRQLEREGTQPSATNQQASPLPSVTPTPSPAATPM